MTSSDTDYAHVFNTTMIFLYRYIAPMAYLSGNIGTLLIVGIFFKKTWRKNVCVFYFKVCLLFHSCYNNWTILAKIFIYGFQINLLPTSTALCKLHFYISYLCVMVSPTVLVLASIDRLLISSRKIDTRLYSSKRLAYFSISIATCMWTLFNVHFLIKVHVIEIPSVERFCYLDLSNAYLTFVSYSVWLGSTSICLVMIVLCIFAFKNVRQGRTVPRSQRIRIRMMTKRDFQLLRCLFAHCVTYICLGTAICTLHAYNATIKSLVSAQMDEVTQTFVTNLFTFFYDLYYSSSFFIFVIVSKAFRLELKSAIYKLIGKAHRREHVERQLVEIHVVTVDDVPS